MIRSFMCIKTLTFMRKIVIMNSGHSMWSVSVIRGRYNIEWKAANGNL